MRNFIFLILILGLGSLFSYAQTPQTNSAKYWNLVTDAETRMLFTAGQDNKLSAALAQSSHFQSVQADFTKMFSGVTQRSSLKVDATHYVQWIDNGLNQKSQVLLVDSTFTNPTLEIYSNFNEGIGIAAGIFQVSLSPKADYVAVMVTEYGSIDQATLKIFSIATQQMVATLPLHELSFNWLTPTTLTYSKLNEDGSLSQSQYDLVAKSDQAVSQLVMSSTGQMLLVQDRISPYNVYFQSSVDGSQVQLDNKLRFASAQLAGADANFIYVLTHDQGTASTLTQYNRKVVPGAVAQTGQVIATEPHLFFDHAWVDSNAVFLQVRAGGDRWLRIYNVDPSGATATQMKQIVVPDCCSIESIRWLVPGQTATVTFTSPAVHVQSFVLDVVNGTWNQDPAGPMLTTKGLTLTSEIVYSASADGTKIPYRLIKRSDLVADQAHTVLIKFYGGFGEAGSIDPSFDLPTLEFLQKGGIFAAPALRGGNEYGEAWHQAAMLANKIKTYQDLDSVAKQLVSDNWVKPDHVVLKGTSNGGLTAAATALLFPQDVGLAIPVAGVNDLLGKDVLDANDGGWDQEYGADNAINDVYLSQISPLENASHQGQVHFLIVDGAEDTRLNPAHSVMLAKALEDLGGSPENVQLLTVANAGHGVEAFAYQNAIAVQTEIVIWTQIFDLAGF